ncbi:MAG: hypothetical protein IIW56_07475 [Oscillospiraceae bacterium]|nr:hypothetical protein [Oscillospiraceae bacterium]
MNDLTFYCAGSSKALYYAAAFLMEEGAVFLPCPDHTVTHLLLPIPSFEADGSIKGGGDLTKILSELPKNVTVIGGNLRRPELEEYEVLDLLDDPWYLARNAGITAHCALELALTKLPVTLEKCPVLVIGWGRIGKCLAKLLHALGACVTVAARKESRRVMIEALGYRSLPIEKIRSEDFRLIINTVPAMVLPEAHGTALKIDLATIPGIAGRDILQARGLPGLLAPESSGSLIAQTIIQWVKEK